MENWKNLAELGWFDRHLSEFIKLFWTWTDSASNYWILVDILNPTPPPPTTPWIEMWWFAEFMFTVFIRCCSSLGPWPQTLCRCCFHFVPGVATPIWFTKLWFVHTSILVSIYIIYILYTHIYFSLWGLGGVRSKACWWPWSYVRFWGQRGGKELQQQKKEVWIQHGLHICFRPWPRSQPWQYKSQP